MKFTKKVLDNGLTILHEKRDIPVTTVMLAVKYGSAYESCEEKGIAHFIEHLCFKGTDKRNSFEVSEEVERLGGDLNAFTHEEVTAYHAKIPSEHLSVAMDVLFDIFYNASFPEEEVEKEANVICEEIKMYRDNPRMHVLDQIKSCLYGGSFGMFIAGTQEIVKGLKRDDLFNRHREVYTPKNSILCVVGNNDLTEIEELVKKLGVERDSKEIGCEKIVLKNEEKSEVRPDLQQTNLAIGFHFPKVSEKGRYASEIFSSILGDGLSSRLVTKIREKRGLVYSIKTDLDLGGDYGYLVIWAGTDPLKLEEVKKASLEEFYKMKDLTQEELDLAKIQVLGNRKIECEDSRHVATNLVLEEIGGNAEDYYSYEKKINEVSLEDIRALAEIKDYSVFSLGP